MGSSRSWATCHNCDVWIPEQEHCLLFGKHTTANYSCSNFTNDHKAAKPVNPDGTYWVDPATLLNKI